jgi:PAT family beta-lactamase induction signal transducer AmpG
VKGAETAQVTPAALGAGYFAFFLYSGLIGIFSIALTFYVVARHRREGREPEPAGAVLED